MSLASLDVKYFTAFSHTQSYNQHSWSEVKSQRKKIVYFIVWLLSSLSFSCLALWLCILKKNIYISPATKFQDYIQTTCCRFLIRQCNQSYYNVSVVARKHTEPHRTAQSRSNFTRRIHNEIGLWQCVPCLWFIALLMSLCQSITSSLTQRGVTCNCWIAKRHVKAL